MDLSTGKPTSNTDNKNTTHSSTDSLAALTSTTTPLTLHYLAEGNANVIYTLSPSSPPNPTFQAHIQCSVLRLRKDLPFTKPCIEVLSAFRTRIAPLFAPDHSHLLMEQTLFKLPPEMIDDANTLLRQMEKNGSSAVGHRIRALGRRGIYHPDFELEPHGILMPNLHCGPDARLLEFKPKWLVQSPSAPEDARRCRTCAVNLMRRMVGREKGKGDSGFCPFALISGKERVIGEVLNVMDPGNGQRERLREEFVQKVQPALRHLQELQRQHGEVGLEHFRGPEGKDFAVAMALRDCSVFLVVADGEKPEIVDIKFADLDLKTPEGGKIERWAAIEEELISKGVYTERYGDDGHPCLWKQNVG